MKSYYKPGAWNAICDRCGLRKKSDDLRKEWTGFMVCTLCWEARHPLDMIRPPREQIGVPWSRPEPTDVFINLGDIIYTEANDPLGAEDSAFLRTETS